MEFVIFANKKNKSRELPYRIVLRAVVVVVKKATYLPWNKDRESGGVRYDKGCRDKSLSRLNAVQSIFKLHELTVLLFVSQEERLSHGALFRAASAAGELGVKVAELWQWRTISCQGVDSLLEHAELPVAALPLHLLCMGRMTVLSKGQNNRVGRSQGCMFWNVSRGSYSR